jgi:hypothetical protein
LRVRVSAAVAEVAGVVRNDKGPATGVTVALVLADAEPGAFPKLATSGEDGSYKISGLAPGKYKLTAVDASDLSSPQGSEADYENVLEIVEIRPGDKLSKDLKCESEVAPTA